MKKNLLLLTLLISFFFPVFSQTLYSSTVIDGNTFTPGTGKLGTPVIALDDILIPSNLVQGSDSVNITKVNFGIVRFANAPATTVNFYYTYRDDTATFVANAITVPPVLIGSIDFPVNGNTDTSFLITIGDSINTLFKVKTDTGGTFSGYQTLFLGLSFSGSDPTGEGLNRWIFTVPGAPASDNKNYVWIYDVDNLPSRLGGSFGQGAPSATFYVEVFGSGSGTPVPVTLSSFNAQRSGKINLIKWTTQQELNARYFVIERSTDGKNFSSIGQVAAAGNSSTVRDYNYIDSHPTSGVNYYRLRTTDKDNSSKLSAIRSVRNLGLADLSIYPNPATDVLTIVINADKATNGHMVIMDVAGNTIYSRAMQLPAGNTTLPVSVSNIAAGSYVMKFQMDDDVIIKKFNKH